MAKFHPEQARIWDDTEHGGHLHQFVHQNEKFQPFQQEQNGIQNFATTSQFFSIFIFIFSLFFLLELVTHPTSSYYSIFSLLEIYLVPITILLCPHILSSFMKYKSMI